MRFGFREAIFFLVLLGMLSSYYFFVLQPRNISGEEARADIQRRQVKLKELEQKTKSIDDLGQEIDKLSEAIAIFEEKLPAQQQVEVILEEVWNLATEHDLTPKSVRTEKIVKSRQYAMQPIKMKIVGNFDGFYEFLLDLEKLPRVTQMPTMKLTKRSSEEGYMDADVVLSIFFEGTERSSERSASAGGTRR